MEKEKKAAIGFFPRAALCLTTPLRAKQMLVKNMFDETKKIIK